MSVLKSESVPYFHAKDFWFCREDGGRISFYAGWDEERHRRFADRLLNVIASHKIYPFASGVVIDAWQMQNPEFYEIYTRNGDVKRQHPFLIAVQRNVHRCAQYCPPGLRMNFVFSNSTVKHVNSAITECFTVVKREAENEPIGERIGSHSYDDCRFAAPLQAADLLAYQAH